MPPFPKPKFAYEYNPAVEIAAIRDYERTKPGRDIPDKAADRLLIASWNIANLGVQERRDQDYRIIAEMVSWFDLCAVQEVNDNLEGLRSIHNLLPARYRLLFSDASGNKERLAFVYDGSKVKLLEKVGEIAIPPSDLDDVKLPDVEDKFLGFDRNPYLAAFVAGSFTFVLVNVHLYWGGDQPKPIGRRCLEAFAVARWGDNRRRSANSYTKDVIAIGDFNLPEALPSDRVFSALTRRGLKLPEHTTALGSTIVEDHHYDQVAFYAGETSGDFTGNAGVFDFDGALFRTLWLERGGVADNPHAQGTKDFNAYMRYYLSDHRILWAQFRI
jgi:endonuclease/exonuclease/phosphatase family metal-dependent hydrolase